MGTARDGLAGSGQKKQETAATIIQWSGCKDDQTSADTKITINENPNCSYLDALRKIRGLLRDEYSQIPQVSQSSLTFIESTSYVTLPQAVLRLCNGVGHSNGTLRRLIGTLPGKKGLYSNPFHLFMTS
ncbi:hypothetical protein DFJ73DRAFT_559860 [Zopfochytrium polystomum]|nr:hypothetical protein DFJ73DRAFT_559860 [Zopfochytrium polystomum]